MVAGVAGIITALAAGLVASTLLYFRSEQSHREATAVVQFLGGMLSGVDPRGGNKDLTVREVLDKVSGSLDDRFRDAPLVRAYLHQTIGNSYHGLGVWNEAEKHAAAAADIRLRELGPEDPLRMESLLLLAYALDRQGEYAHASAVLDELIPLSLRVFGEEAPETLDAVFRKAVVLLEQREVQEAEALHRQGYEIRRRVFGEQDPTTLVSAYYLAECALRQRRFSKAERSLRELLQARQRVLGPEHPDTLHTMNNLGWALERQGRYAEAAAVHQQTLEIRRRILGDRNADTLMSMRNLALVIQYLGRHEEAQRLFMEALEGDRSVLGEGHWRTPDVMNDYAWWLLTCEVAELRDPRAVIHVLMFAKRGLERRLFRRKSTAA